MWNLSMSDSCCLSMKLALTNELLPPEDTVAAWPVTGPPGLEIPGDMICSSRGLTASTSFLIICLWLLVLKKQMCHHSYGINKNILPSNVALVSVTLPGSSLFLLFGLV